MSRAVIMRNNLPRTNEQTNERTKAGTERGPGFICLDLDVAKMIMDYLKIGH